MVIIVEGIDRTGKTTLIKRMEEEIEGSKKFKAERIVVPYTNKEENNLLNYGYCMGQVQLFNETYANSKDRHIIIDRFHWTEYVYTKIQRDNKLEQYYVRNIELEMLKNKPGYLMILMMPVDIKVCSRKHGSDLSEHQKLFEKLYKESNLLKYKSTYFSNDMTIETVKKFIDGTYTKQGE